jgi:putative ABC transport system permease protein
MEALVRDLHLAARGLVRRPAYAFAATATLAVAIGFNATIFSVVQGVLLDPLPYRDPGRLVVLRESHPEQGVQGVSAPNFLDWRERARTLEEAAAYRYWGFAYAGGEEPLEVPSLLATPSLFSLLGAEAALGRTFTDDEGVSGRDKVVVVSHDFWQRHLGGASDVLGRVIELDAEPYQVVGVMPPGFAFPPEDDVEVWGALAFDLADRRHDGNRNARSSLAVARLRDGVDLTAARGELDAIAAELAVEYPASQTGWGVRTTGLHDGLVGGVRPVLLTLFGAVALLLAIACANLANLTLGRLLARRRELAVRMSLGAARRHLVRQLLTESVAVALAGGLAGLALAALGARWVSGFSSEVLPRSGRVELDAGVALFTLALCSVSALAFGLLPALRASRRDLAEHLRGQAVTPPASQRLFGAVAVGQVALAVVLAAGAGLLARSFGRLADVDPGFDPERVLAANVFLPRATYVAPHQKKAFYDRMLAEVAAAPGVESVGAVTALPLDEVGVNFDLPFTIEGAAPVAAGEEPQADFRVATPGYFATLRVALVRGRLFDQRDHEDAPRVMVINQTMARRHFPAGDPLGRFITIPMGGRHEVIGVVADLKHYGLASDTRPETYVAFAQQPFGSMTVVARVGGEPAAYGETMKDAARSADSGQAVYRLVTLRSLLDDVLFMPRLHAVVLGVFAACSCLLAAVGLYGVMASMVAGRRREIGIRLALGARAGEVLRMVIGRGMALAVAGIGAGLALAAVATRLLAAFLFEVDPLDPAVLAGAAAGFAAVALAANLLPAIRAMRVDPVETLAAE